MQTSHRKGFAVAGLIIGAWVTIILFAHSPLQQNVPSRDSGVFLYIGQQILNGQIPYRDVWDHKGPVVYYLNAFGLWLGQGSWWGVWGLQWLSLAGAAILGYVVLSKAFGNKPAIFASLVWLTSLIFLLDGGNFTEEYALFFQFAALYLFWKSQKSSQPLVYVILIGITLAVVFWLKLNMIGLQLSITLVTLVPMLFSPDRKKVMPWSIALFAGALLVTIPLLSYFAWNGALDELADEVFRYNFVYATSTLEDKIKSTLGGLQLLSQSSIAFTAVTAWIIGGFTFFSKSRQTGAHTPLIQVALVGLPVELFLASTSGRIYVHYYIIWLPILSILTAQLAVDFWNYFASAEIIFLRRKIELKLIWSMAIAIAVTLPALTEMIKPAATVIKSNYPPPSAILNRIQKYSNQNDYLLMWGAETSYNFLTGRRAPSRFVYQYPLYTCNYATDVIIAEFLDGIARHKPLIVDTSATKPPYVPPLDAEARAQWNGQSFAGGASKSCTVSAQMNPVFYFINTHYRVVEVVQPEQWIIYRYAGDQ